MFENKIEVGQALGARDRRKLKRAYQGRRAMRPGGIRIFLLALLAVFAVMMMSQAVLAVGGDAGERIAGDIFNRPV